MLERTTDRFLDKDLEILKEEVVKMAKHLSEKIKEEQRDDLGGEIRWVEERDGVIDSWVVVLVEDEKGEKKIAMVCKKELWSDKEGEELCIETWCDGDGNFMYQSKNVVSLGHDEEGSLTSRESLEVEAGIGSIWRAFFVDGEKDS